MRSSRSALAVRLATHPLSLTALICSVILISVAISRDSSEATSLWLVGATASGFAISGSV
jgi:hypothetical protein